MTTPESTDRATPTNAYEPPKATLATDAESSGSQTTPGQRIAGIFFIVGAILSIFWTIVRARPVLPPFEILRLSVFSWLIAFAASFIPIAAIGIDIVLGVMLLAKRKRAVPLAILRVVAALMVFGLAQLLVIRVESVDPLDLLWLLMGSGGLLLLLARNAKKTHMLIGMVLFGIHTLVRLWGMAVNLTGIHPLATFIETSSGDINGEPVTNLIGKVVPYKLTLPSDKWYLRTDKAIVEDNSGADRWISRPDVDAHVMVVVEDAPTAALIPDKYADTTVKAFKEQRYVSHRERSPLRTHPERGRLQKLEVLAQRTEWFVGTVSTYQRGFIIYAFAPRNVFDSLESELRGIVESFELPPDEVGRIPDDWEKGPVTHVEGVAQKYAFTVPFKNCFLRKTDAAKKENPRADRWLVCPDKGAEIIVIAAETKDSVINIEKYTDSMLENIALNANETFLSREVLKSRPSVGRIVHTTAVVDGTKYKYLYGLFAEGPRAFQVIASARAESFGGLKEDFTQMIEQFELPRQ